MSRTYEPGRYIAKVSKQALAKSRSGKTQFVLSFIPQGKINPADEMGPLDSCANYERSIFRTITDKTIEYFIEDLKALDFDGGPLARLDPRHPNAFSFVGKEIDVLLKYRDYEGKEREDWSLWRDTGGGMMDLDLADGRDAKALDALYGTKVKAAFKDAPKPPPQEPQREPEPEPERPEFPEGGRDEDLPF